MQQNNFSFMQPFVVEALSLCTTTTCNMENRTDTVSASRPVAAKSYKSFLIRLRMICTIRLISVSAQMYDCVPFSVLSRTNCRSYILCIRQSSTYSSLYGLPAGRRFCYWSDRIGPWEPNGSTAH